ncbi:HD domain-containing protein [Kribbella sp. VKM Ac-2571]|uniref:HD domain-containing protein n=1 Tax=Kribbella sp. VKM Ac-2571 TaxID=2512222 RepID=UPI0010616189|nr:HD domain-containing protein [Kribbella sp. VKM Ac-2571]TDO56705.1 HD domain-containing protein [Kribbella sp. VKM Ac-2571]
MTEIIAAVRIPETPAAAEAAQWVREHSSSLIYHHSRRVFVFGMLHARLLGLEPDPELVYLSALFHDAGLLTPFSDTEQRFELDGADHARQFLLERGFSKGAADVVWTAIALHTTPGVPSRMGPEIAVTTYGVLTDAIGFGLDQLEPADVAAVTAADPRGDFKQEFLQTFVDALKDRPDTTFGTMNADVLAEFVPGFRRLSVVDRIRSAPWPT